MHIVFLPSAFSFKFPWKPETVTTTPPPDQRFDLTASAAFCVCCAVNLEPRGFQEKEQEQQPEQEKRRSTWWSTRQRIKVLKRDYYFTCCVDRMLLCCWELVKGYYDIVRKNHGREVHFELCLPTGTRGHNRTLIE